MSSPKVIFGFSAPLPSITSYPSSSTSSYADTACLESRTSLLSLMLDYCVDRSDSDDSSPQESPSAQASRAAPACVFSASAPFVDSSLGHTTRSGPVPVPSSSTWIRHRLPLAQWKLYHAQRAQYAAQKHQAHLQAGGDAHHPLDVK